MVAVCDYSHFLRSNFSVLDLLGPSREKLPKLGFGGVDDLAEGLEDPVMIPLQVLGHGEGCLASLDDWLKRIIVWDTIAPSSYETDFAPLRSR
jgi:hypothetical protein